MRADWYELPAYYDLVFDLDTATEADFLEAAFRRHGRAVPSSRRPRALEPACGTGRLTVELARRGWETVGFDRSRTMLDFAESRLDEARESAEAAGEPDLRCRLAEARLARFEPGDLGLRARERFDLAFCLVSTFKYLGTERAARSHLRSVARSLAPGGLYILGLHLAEYADREASSEQWRAVKEGLEVVSTLTARPADPVLRRERCELRLRVRENGRARSFEDSWYFRTYDDRQLRHTLGAIDGLELVAVYGFDYELDDPLKLDGDRLDLVCILRRKGGGS
jgi:SAM-dependent methyltransferase